MTHSSSASEAPRPTADHNVLFVCQSNRGKSAMAAGLFAKRATDFDLDVTVASAGTKAECGAHFNEESAKSLSKVGASMGCPGQDGANQLTEQMLKEADRVILIGENASLEDFPAAEGVKVERWRPVEPSTQGFEGEERMDMLRKRIDRHVMDLVSELYVAQSDEAGTPSDED